MKNGKNSQDEERWTSKSWWSRHKGQERGTSLHNYVMEEILEDAISDGSYEFIAE